MKIIQKISVSLKRCITLSIRDSLFVFFVSEASLIQVLFFFFFFYMYIVLEFSSLHHSLVLQVDNVSGNSSTLSMAEPQVVFSRIIQWSCEPLCIAWLVEELRLKHSKAAEVLLKLNILPSQHCCYQHFLKKEIYDLFLPEKKSDIKIISAVTILRMNFSPFLRDFFL